MTDFDAIFKAYDVRGTVPDQFTADGAKAIGGAFARFVASQGETSMVVGHDMRPEGEEFSQAFGDGALEHGVDVIDVGLCATDMMYYASGVLDMPGAVFTASHNPAGYNGIKMCLGGAAPIAGDTGLDAIKAMAIAGPDPSGRTGARTEQHMLPGYVDHVRSFVDVSSLRPLKVVADTANGMGGLVVPAVFDGLPFLSTTCIPNSTAPFRTIPPIRSSRRTNGTHGAGPGDECRHRPCVRWRRRPGVSGRRDRPGDLRLTHHGDGGPLDPRQESRRDDPSQPDLFEDSA